MHCGVPSMKLSNVCRAAALAFVCLGATPAFATITFYHNDALGSPILTTNGNGAVRWRARYRPYGDRNQSAAHYAASLSNRVWYGGHAFDPATGLSYLQARYYNPVLGRFVSPDPAGVRADDPLTFNRYLYARNNPYRFIDPDGRESVAITVKGAGSAGVGVNANLGVYFTFPLFDDVPFDAGLYSGGAVVAGADAAVTANLVLLAGGRENLEGQMVSVSATAPLTGVAGPAVDAEVMINPRTGTAAGSSLGVGLALLPSASVAYGASSIDFSVRDTVLAFFGADDKVFNEPWEADLWFSYISG